MIADSQAPVPEPGKRKTVPVSDLKTFFTSLYNGIVNSGISGFL